MFFFAGLWQRVHSQNIRGNNRNILLTVSSLIRDRIRISSPWQHRDPQLFSRLYIKSAEAVVVARRNKQHAAGRDNRTGQYGPSGILLLRRQLFRNADRRLPDNISSGSIDRGQSTPGRLLTRQVLLSDANVESVSPRIGFFIWRRRAIARFLHRADRADILRRDEDVTRTGIECGSTPICAA